MDVVYDVWGREGLVGVGLKRGVLIVEQLNAS